MAGAKKAGAKKAAAPEPEKAPEEAVEVEAVDPDARFASALDEAEQAKVTESTPNQERDRVAMLSVRADGTPDQYDPELIGEQPDDEG